MTMGAAGHRLALVFGGSGQIGAALMERLLAAGWQVIAVSRDEQAARAGVTWRRGDFSRLPALPERCDAVFSCGPLDHFADWYRHAAIASPYAVAFGSTSLTVKHAAADPDERALASRLQAAERQVFAAARRRDVHATVLRPTLVYGAARDRSLSRVVTLARRSGFFALPADAVGLRQPVHVDDLADAALAAIDAPASAGKAYALPGGETLPYRVMVARALATQVPRPRLLTLPGWMFHLILKLAHGSGRLHGLPPGAVARMREDLVFDDAPARADLHWRPRRFDPDRSMFPSP